MKTKELVHYAPKYFFNPTHPISIALIGCGGTGSHLLTRLARINYTLKELNHPGISVEVFDADSVDNFNVARQNFNISDVGENKAIALVSKINNVFGFDWKANPFNYSAKKGISRNIMITAVDNGKFRDEFQNCNLIESYHEYSNNYYWLDLGNAKAKGQYVLGSKEIPQIKQGVEKLKTIIDKYGNVSIYDTEQIQGTSCSMRSKLNEQSLFINDIIASYAADLLFKLIWEKVIDNQGGFVNLKTTKNSPIKLC